VSKLRGVIECLGPRNERLKRPCLAPLKSPLLNIFKRLGCQTQRFSTALGTTVSPITHKINSGKPAAGSTLLLVTSLPPRASSSYLHELHDRSPPSPCSPFPLLLARPSGPRS
jgi:hypothetical protein